MASAHFNSGDWDSWYFEKISRTQSQEKLLGQPHGTFLVRDSSTCPGDYVLSVSENSKVSHYIINKAQNVLKIGDQSFDSMPKLLEFYKVHYLDTTTLITAVLRSTPVSSPASAANRGSSISMGYPDKSQGDQQITSDPEPEKHFVQGLFDFKSDDPDDLQFVKGEVLEIIEKPEENWWNARNKNGQIGQIPVPYVGKLVPGRNSMTVNYQMPPGATQQQVQRPVSMPTANTPVYAEVITKRVPNAYDPTALSLEVGDIITVTKMNMNGQWEGESRGKKGLFPFTHVRILESKMEGR